jgi:hypothetical protein
MKTQERLRPAIEVAREGANEVMGGLSRFFCSWRLRPLAALRGHLLRVALGPLTKLPTRGPICLAPLQKTRPHLLNEGFA